jgi:glutamate dehydrogenase (NAD(P)+)
MIDIDPDTPTFPALVIEYTDPVEGFKGWMVRDTFCHKICAGGMRVHPHLECAHLAGMAANMTRKMRLAQLRVDGAKCGIRYDPASPGKKEAIGRFLSAIRPYIETSYSMGPDLNVKMEELEEIASSRNIASIKMAIAGAQGWTLSYFHERMNILNTPLTGNWNVGRLRAGYGVCAAVLATLKHLAIDPSEAKVSVQGFGTLAKGTIFGLLQHGVTVVAAADAEKCIISPSQQGLAMQTILDSPGSLLPDQLEGKRDRPETINNISCDIMIPAAIENTVNSEVAGRIQVKGVVPGANLAVTPEAAAILYERGITLIPDFLAGCGGSLSMEGLFGPDEHPAPEEILSHINYKMQQLVNKVLDRSIEEDISPTEAALRFCSEAPCYPDARPYGKLS